VHISVASEFRHIHCQSSKVLKIVQCNDIHSERYVGKRYEARAELLIGILRIACIAFLAKGISDVVTIFGFFHRSANSCSNHDSRLRLTFASTISNFLTLYHSYLRSQVFDASLSHHSLKQGPEWRFQHARSFSRSYYEGNPSEKGQRWEVSMELQSMHKQ